VTTLRRSNATTIADVAAAAGVSISTVSRVVRDDNDVSPATREKVQDVIASLGYRPSSIARALVSGQTQILALFVSDLTNPFYPQLFKAVERAAAQAGYAVIVCSTDDDDDTAAHYVERLLQQGLDGLIYASSGGEEDTLVELLGDPRRLVFVNRRPKVTGCSFVVSDNRAGSASLTRHLLQNGHRMIGFIGGPSFAANANERLDGFHDAMREVPGATALVSSGPFSKDTGLKATSNWLKAGLPMTAIIGVNDTVALGAMEGILDRGLRVPEDMSVAGFDNVDLASSSVLRLSTVAQDIAAMGSQAVQILLGQLRRKDRFAPTQVILPSSLHLRQSTDARRE
jgi:LacI family transcriptional regulator